MMLAPTQLCTYALCSCALCLVISTLVESALQIRPFLTNKANFPKSQMNVSTFITMNYEQRTMNDEIKNKANSNPIQSQFKPNTNPKQTQYEPNSNPIYPVVASGEAGTNPIYYLLYCTFPMPVFSIQ